MLIDDRAMVLADGPLTVVAAFRATAGERASAYPPHQSHWIIERLCRDAQGGDRHVLVDICQLLFDHSTSGICNISTTVFAERVRDAVGGGRVLLIPGWPRMRGYASAPLSQDSRASESRLARRIMKDEDHLAFGGEKYAVVPVQSWDELRRAGTHEVVAREQAFRILKRLAAHPAFSDRRMALDEAASQLAQTHARVGREGVLVVRHLEPLPASAPVRAAPAPASSASAPAGRKSPSLKEPPPAKTRKVLSIAWDQPDAWCSENVAYHGTTDGYAAGDSLKITLQEQGHGAHEASLKLSSSTEYGKAFTFDAVPP